jgi:hypothetical protein
MFVPNFADAQAELEGPSRPLFSDHLGFRCDIFVFGAGVAFYQQMKDRSLQENLLRRAVI